MIINLCPHSIHLYSLDRNGDIDGNVRSFHPSGVVARCEENTSPVFIVGENLPVVNKWYGEVIGLPERVEGTFYIVSMMIRSALPGRTDLLSPGDAIRDESGKIIGCINFVIN
jgi:hypothetical protein